MRPGFRPVLPQTMPGDALPPSSRQIINKATAEGEDVSEPKTVRESALQKGFGWTDQQRPGLESSEVATVGLAG